jgi:hypothetical protein
MNTQDETQETNSAYNPFPEPQTIPSGWDTSVFSSAFEPVSVEETENTTES